MNRFNLQEAAAFLGLHEHTVEERVRAGEIKAYKPGRRLVFLEADLRRRVAWVDAEEAKGRKPIGIPLSDDAVAILECQAGEHAKWVFPYRGEPLEKIRGAWGRAITRAVGHELASDNQCAFVFSADDGCQSVRPRLPGLTNPLFCTKMRLTTLRICTNEPAPTLRLQRRTDFRPSADRLRMVARRTLRHGGRSVAAHR